MKLYRIGPESLLENYSGLGASYRDGARWNSPGLPVLYFACSPAVALLEMANYLPSPRLVPPGYRLGIYQLPDSIKPRQLPRRQLPDDWAHYPHPIATQGIGDKWLKAGREALMLVPSAAVPAGLEQIAVFNPQHPDSKRIRLLEVVETIYNSRMFSGHTDMSR